MSYYLSIVNIIKTKKNNVYDRIYEKKSYFLHLKTHVLFVFNC